MRNQRRLCLMVLTVAVVCYLVACVPAESPPIRSGNPSAASGSSQPQRAFGVVGAGGRSALVIGNGAYKENPLPNPPNDAQDVAAKLRDLGFRVQVLINANQQQMEQAVTGFSRGLGSGDAGLFYYAGHGLQVNGVNYLVPVGVEIGSEAEVKYRAVNANMVLDQMNDSKNGLNILILDACRDNPLGRGFRRSGGQAGLAPITADPSGGTGAFIAFATSPGQTAGDGTGRNGTFTKHLLANMDHPGWTVEQVFKQTRAGVMQETGNKQVPWESSSIVGDFYFVQRSAPPAASSSPAPAASPSSTPSSSPPSIQTAGGMDVEELARQRKKEQEEWAAWQKRMEAEYAKLEKHDKEQLLTEKEKEEMWGTFLTAFAGDNKYSQNDEVLRAKAQQRQEYWRQKRAEAEDKARMEAEPEKPSGTSAPPLAAQTFTNSLGQKFVLIPPGTFMMGSPLSEPGRENDEMQHQVSISRPFYIQTTEVTQGQWKAVMQGGNPSRFKDCGDDCPVERVSWGDVQEFISRLNSKEGSDRYRLPSEAEWEYAARAGSRSVYSFGDDASHLVEFAWYQRNSENKTHRVGGRQPNAWGLYDMYGNVWEWCQDWYWDYFFNAVTDPRGAVSGTARANRGGSWDGDARYCRSAGRSRDEPGIRYDYLGFRLVMTP